MMSMSVNVTTNSPSQEYTPPDDYTSWTYGYNFKEKMKLCLNNFLTWEDCSSFGSRPVFLSQKLVQSILILIEFAKIHMGDHVISNHCS